MNMFPSAGESNKTQCALVFQGYCPGKKGFQKDLLQDFLLIDFETASLIA